MFFNKKKNSSKKADKETDYVYEFIKTQDEFSYQVIERARFNNKALYEINKQLLELSKKVDELYDLCSNKES